MELNLMSEISNSIKEGNIVDLPHEVLEQLDENDISPPYFFQISTQSKLTTYVGVKQFTSDKDTIEIPYWLYNQLCIPENEIINVKLLSNVPKGKYIKICPECEDFFDIPEYEACLELKLSSFPLLYQGQIIVVNILDKEYQIKIQDIDMDWEIFNFEDGTESLEFNVIDVINTDLNVDIKNKFIEKRLIEEKLAKELVKQKMAEDNARKKLEEENAKKKLEEINKGNVLVEGEIKSLSKEEVRLARLKFLSEKKD